MRLPPKLPGPWRITFDTNPDLCNLRCIMCEVHSIYNPNPPRTNRIMPIETIERVLRSTHKYLKEIIPSTMGEPLLYPYFKRLIDLIDSYNLKMNITTNGTFPILGVEKWGYLLMPIVSDIKVSVNGATPKTAEKIMVGLDFNKQIENLKKLVEIRDQIRAEGINYPTITMQATFMEMNLEELPQMLEMAIDIGLDRFKGHHLWVTWPQLAQQSLKRSVESIRRWNRIVDKLYEIKKRRRSKIVLSNIYKLPEDLTPHRVPENWICPFLGREAWIAWDGTFNICCAPDRLRRLHGYFGNVNETDFMELWNSEKYNKLVATWGRNPVCKICNMRRPPEDVHRYLVSKGVIVGDKI